MSGGKKFWCRLVGWLLVIWRSVVFYLSVVVMQADKQNCAIIRSITMVTASTSTHLWASGLIQSGRRRSLSVWSMNPHEAFFFRSPSNCVIEEGPRLMHEAGPKIGCNHVHSTHCSLEQNQAFSSRFWSPSGHTHTVTHTRTPRNEDTLPAVLSLPLLRRMC